MNTKIKLPDWNAPAYMMISRSADGKGADWAAYKKDSGNLLSLRVTLEIAGGSCLFERFEDEQARERARVERDRQAAWRNAIRFAEQLQKAEPHRQYVVSFRPENPNVGREAVCIYQRIETIT